MTRLSAGSEIDGYCTKCRMDLTHRIVAMAGDRVARVECLTCRTQHNHHRPKSAEPDRAPRVRRIADPKTAARTSTQSPVGQRLHWEKLIAGHMPSEFTPYTPAGTYRVAQLVKHAKFGDGAVTEVPAPTKVLVLFADGPKLLAQAPAS